MTRLCQQCLQTREEKDFYVEGLCYKCQFHNKITISDEIKSILVEKVCEECGEKFMGARRLFCSRTCSRKAKRNQDGSYWYNKIKKGTPALRRFVYGANKE